MEGSLVDGWADNIKPLLLRAEARARVRTRARYLDRETWAGLSACLLNGSDDWSPDPASCHYTINSHQSQLEELSQVKSRPSPCRKLKILSSYCLEPLGPWIGIEDQLADLSMPICPFSIFVSFMKLLDLRPSLILPPLLATMPPIWGKLWEHYSGWTDLRINYDVMWCVTSFGKMHRR